jgi:hypothetical protein
MIGVIFSLTTLQCKITKCGSVVGFSDIFHKKFRKNHPAFINWNWEDSQYGGAMTVHSFVLSKREGFVFRNRISDNFHSCTVHIGTITVFYLPTDAQYSCFKRIVKFTLKQLLHVSVQSPSSASVLFELVKVIVIKIIS